MKYPAEPTAEKLEGNGPVIWLDEYGKEQTGYACWYPQMGGYVGKCVIYPHDNGCFDAYVWHDGEFPFSDESAPGRSPVKIHHCDAEHFVEFGKLAQKLCDGDEEP